MRSVAVSPEMLATVLVWLGWLLFPDAFKWLDGITGERANIPFWGSTAMFACGVVCLWKILFPSSNNSDLIEWERYPDLRTTTMIGIVFITVGFILVWVGGTAARSLATGVASALVINGLLVSALSLFTMLLGAVTIKSLVEGGR